MVDIQDEYDSGETPSAIQIGLARYERDCLKRDLRLFRRIDKDVDCWEYIGSDPNLNSIVAAVGFVSDLDINRVHSRVEPGANRCGNVRCYNPNHWDL